jgi:phenylpropionate dioxygenase-like ring-hydroxylating dioxygenase large terminal subunit
MRRVPAPLDHDRVRAILGATLGESRTLPAAAYLGEDVFAWEQHHFFEGSWHCAGRSADLANPGDQRAVRIGGEGVLVVRGADGILRGF